MKLSKLPVLVRRLYRLCLTAEKVVRIISWLLAVYEWAKPYMKALFAYLVSE